MDYDKSDGALGNIHGQDFNNSMKKAQSFIVLISLAMAILGASVVIYSILIK